MGLRRVRILAVGFVALAAGDAFARNDIVPGSRYLSGRGAALGDAYIPLADDGSSLFYNPAGIGKIRGTLAEPLNFQFQLNNGYFDTMDANFTKVASLSKYQPTLGANTGTWVGGSGAIFPSFAFRGFALGLLYQNSFLGRQNEGGTLSYKSKIEFIPTVGFGVRLASGVVRVGYSLQYVNKAVGDVTVANTDGIGYNEQLTQGSALSHTAGIALTLPVSYLPSFNFVARNIFNALYSDSTVLALSPTPQNAPPDELMSYDASFSVQPKIARGAYMNFTLQYRDLTSTSGVSLFGRLSSGLEFSFRDQFFLRGGLGSGYPSAGFGLKRKTAEFSLSWFSEEIGASYLSERDIRYMLHYQIRMF